MPPRVSPASAGVFGVIGLRESDGFLPDLNAIPEGIARRAKVLWLNYPNNPTAAVADHLKKEVQQRLEKAGVEVLEARFSHMAYAPEIAASMLQRQQAGAIIAARQRIVEGAVGMVEMALQALSQKEIVRLDEERKAAMVSNLLVVLCGERSPQPIVNTGTIHQ